MASTNAKWARWNWKRGLGRGHRLFTDGDLTKTACQTPRKTAEHTAVATYTSKPADGPLCSRCELFDQLHEKFVNSTDLVTPITIEASPMTEPALPATVGCACGCVKTDAFIAWKIEHDAWEAAELTRKTAEFAAFLAKGTVAA